MLVHLAQLDDPLGRDIGVLSGLVLGLDRREGMLEAVSYTHLTLPTSDLV